MIEVEEVEVSESLRILVSFELRYGTWSAPVVSALTTFPRLERERLIFLVYSRVIPLTPLLRTFSLPARSMKHSFTLFF